MKEAAIMIIYKIITTCFSPPLQDPCDEILANTIKQSTQQRGRGEKKEQKERTHVQAQNDKSPKWVTKGAFTLGVRDSSVEFLNTILVI
jgi:hypothetical protein